MMKFPSPPQIILSEDFKEKYPTTDFIISIKTANKTLNDISSGKEGGEGYQRIKQALIAFANGQADFPQIEGIRDIQRIIAVLNQEKNSANNKNNDIFQQLIDNNKALYTVQIIGHYLSDNNNLIGQKLLELYYNRYFLFENYAKAKFATLFKTLLKRSVNNYNGKNHRVKKAQEIPYIIDNNLKKLLENYSFNSNQLEDLRQELCLQEVYEIWQKILILQLIETVNQWQANENNDDVKKTWRE